MRLMVRRAVLAASVLVALAAFFLPLPAVAQSGASLWTSTDGPSGSSGTDAASIEVGTTVQTSAAGAVTGVRFYKNTNSTGTHTGNLWTSSGTLLGSVTFSGETSSGWQQADFATPISVGASTNYVVSYHTSYYRATLNYFASALTSGYLTAPIGAGLYRYGSGPSLFPNSSYSNANYWVDVVFSAGSATPTPTPTPSPTVASTNTPTPGPTATPTPTVAATATPSPTNTPTATATAISSSAFTCTEIVGFSVTDAWYNAGFIGAVADPTHYQLRWFSGGSIDQWAAGSAFSGWTNSANLVTQCAAGSSAPDRVILNVSGQYDDDPSWWAAQTQLAVNYIHGTYAPGATIIVQPPVGAPSSIYCSATATPPYVRASYNHGYVVTGLGGVTGATLGALPELASCADYVDSTGHISTAAATAIGQQLATYYSQTR